jgi:lipoyl(octanoyl) transferase
MAELQIRELGKIGYLDALKLQHELRDERRADTIPDTVLSLQHPPVYTRGRRSEPGELPFAPEWYAERGIEVIDVDRGGKITYHGPGQLVLYPICQVVDVAAFVCSLERAMVTALAQEGIEAHGRSTEGIEYTGAWVAERKIGSIGIHVSKGITTHGLSLNVDCDLEPFSWIVACGLGDTRVTSIKQERGTATIEQTRGNLLDALAAELGAGSLRPA